MLKKDTPKDKFLIKGLGGKKNLEGKIEISGAKNDVLKIMAGSVLFKGDLIIENVPEIQDVETIKKILEDLGAKIENIGKNKIKINTNKISKTKINKELAGKIRASIVLIGPMLARFGEVSFPHPGGDVIAERPIGMFLNGLRGMGAKDKMKKNGLYEFRAINKKLKGKTVFFSKQSVTATETLLMASVLAKGKSVLKNVAMEPEIVNLSNFLIKCGAKIKGVGTTTLEIKGGGMLEAGKNIYKVIPDRIEAGSYIILGALASKDLLIKNCNPLHLESLLSSLRFSGVHTKTGKNWVRVKNDLGKTFKSLEIKTHEYPGFITDMQSPMTVFLTQTKGMSSVFETIFENRLGFVKDLNKMGAKIKTLHPQKILIEGPTPLKGATLKSPDLRAGMTFIIAAIIAKGDSVIENAYHIDRGYEGVEKKLSSIGVNIKRVKS